MRFPADQHREQATWFQRACAVLCLLLLIFSVAHTVSGHADTLTAPFAGPSATHTLQPVSPDTPDTCVLCVAMTTIVVLAVLALTAPQRTRPRPAVRVMLAGPVCGWYTCLFSRPPPAC